jgi:hypothetical protein
MKTCTKCGIDKELEEFYKRGAKRQSRCKVCQGAERSKYYKKHDTIRLQLGLTHEQVEEITSPGMCQACGATDRKLCIDHDHKTMQPRGLLCHNCNTALGLVNDDPSILLNLLTYLNPSAE